MVLVVVRVLVVVLVLVTTTFPVVEPLAASYTQFAGDVAIIVQDPALRNVTVLPEIVHTTCVVEERVTRKPLSRDELETNFIVVSILRRIGDSSHSGCIANKSSPG